MARPVKYNWIAIREIYEKGFTKDEIVRKFRVPKSTLTNKINKEHWKILGSVDNDIAVLNATSKEIAQNYTKTPEIAELFEKRLDTMIDDNKLIGNNRKLLLASQGVIGDAFKKDRVSIGNIKSITSAIRDIENIANPQNSKVEVNTQNNIIQEPIKIEWE